MAVPAGVADGDRFSFNLWLPRGPRTRVDVRVAVTGSAPLKRHVDFLSTLYVTWGAIFALVAVAGFALAGGAFAIAQSTGPVRFGSEMAARLTGVTISIIALIALVWAVLHLVVGRS